METRLTSPTKGVYIIYINVGTFNVDEVALLPYELICIDLKLLTLLRKQFNIGPKAVRENLAL